MLYIFYFNIIQIVTVRGAPQISNVSSFNGFCIDTPGDGLNSGRYM